MTPEQNGVRENRGAWAGLSKIFAGNRPPHAVILEGEPGGTGALAARLAQASVCLAAEGKPCGSCPGCIKAKAGSHPDILTLDGNANPRVFPVDTVRKIRSDAYEKPNEAPRRVFVLLGVQNMSEISQNALLKILEEPPENVLFILTTTSAAQLLPTVRSRAQLFPVEGESLPEDWTLAETIAKAVVATREAELIFQAADLIQNRDGMRGVLEQLSLIFRDAVALRSGAGGCRSAGRGAASLLGDTLTRQNLMRMLEATEKARQALEQNANTALLVTAYCAALRSAAGR